ncbi:DUF2931 family protein [Dyella terrae]|uniref:DUF2931 family protein n=1 Tax=Dyella terrae TaxID=522259 RepID=UPI001EFEE574|nr:DUF2931 family protein [Dyella terrae]ULU25332.1 hypothetical protein DYST_02258 [Dyella terrae]
MNRWHKAISRLLLVLLSALLLPACASEEYSDARIRREATQNCRHWSMMVGAPRFMEAWVETLEVTDDRGRTVVIPQGMAGSLGQTVGWDGLGGAGGTTIDSAGAPMQVFVRWQSLAEPQTYRWQFTVPASVRQALVKQEAITWRGRAETSCRQNISIGVAPGGRTVVWINGIGMPAVEVMRGQEEVEPLGPDQGQHGGRYVRFSDQAKQYVEEHGIPYGSW